MDPSFLFLQKTIQTARVQSTSASLSLFLNFPCIAPKRKSFQVIVHMKNARSGPKNSSGKQNGVTAPSKQASMVLFGQGIALAGSVHLVARTPHKDNESTWHWLKTMGALGTRSKTYLPAAAQQWPPKTNAGQPEARNPHT